MDKIKIQFIPWRFYLISLVILLVVLGLIARMIDLTVIQRPFLRSQGNARALRVINEPAFRGMITDRNGYPLAISTSVFSIWVNPKEFSAQPGDLRKLSKMLAIPTQKIVQLSQNKHKEFVYIKRTVSPDIANQIKKLKITGVYLEQDYKRFYPEGEIAAHVIGFTNIDDKGQEGLELAYDPLLTGKGGKKLVLQDRLGRSISEVQTIQQQRPGHDLVLSINRRIQYIAYRALLEGVQENKARSGSAIVLDAKTGEILAMVNQPSFNPNMIAKQNKESFRNRAVTDIFEPGSTIKTFSVAVGLKSGKYHPDTLIDTNPGWWRVEHNLVQDEHNQGVITLTEILQYSSNVGISKMILSLPSKSLWAMLHSVGFGQKTGVEFPGEEAGKLVDRPVWRPFALATLSFGYGISVTPLQLAQAYDIIANGGVKVPMTLLRLDKPPVGQRVMDAKLANELLHVLQAVLEKGGTGVPARVPGYQVAGKTGTARMIGADGYEKHHHMSSFVGIAPVSQPRLVVVVVIQDPQGKKYFGGDVSGPVFEKIMEDSLRILNIPPDSISSKNP